MSGPHTIPFLPTEIPVDVDINAVKADVRDDGVSAPAQYVPQLHQVVEEAKQKGIDLKIVVIPTSPQTDGPMRDIATEVGHAYPDATVLAVSPLWAGTYSRKYDRVTLEAGQDQATNAGDHPVQASQNFLHVLATPPFPWTGLTIALVVAVALSAVITRVLQLRARNPVAPSGPSEAESRDPDTEQRR
jgi:hypothetical protein